MAPASQSYESLPTSTKALAGIPPPKPGATADVSGVPEVKDLAQNLEQPSLKRKEVESSGSNRFKIVSQLVIAMRRFQASLNPTYTYGKRPSPSPSTSRAASSRSMQRSSTPIDESSEVTSVSSVSRQNSRSGDRGASKVPRPRTKHGHKTDYLFGSLPPVPQRFERQAASCTQEQ